MKNKSDSEVFKLYQQAKREIESFIAIGSKEDEEQFADMNTKDLGPEKAIEAAMVQEVVKEKEAITMEESKKAEKVIEKESNADNVPSPSQIVKRRGVKRKKFARKKRKVDIQSSLEYEEEEEDKSK